MLALVALGAILFCAFRYAGRMLVVSDHLTRGDAIVILGGNRLERTLEAGLLYREGWAGRIVIGRSGDPAIRSFLDREHIKVPLFSDLQVSVLHQMGVPPAAILEFPGRPNDTVEEAVLTQSLAARHGWSRVIVVTSKYHTRRARSIFRRVARGRFQLICRPSRLDPADPDHWWRFALDRMDVTWEYVKYPVTWWRLLVRAAHLRSAPPVRAEGSLPH